MESAASFGDEHEALGIVLSVRGSEFADTLRLQTQASQLTVDAGGGNDVIISASVSDADAQKQFPNGWKTLKPYLRVVPQPK